MASSPSRQKRRQGERLQPFLVQLTPSLHAQLVAAAKESGVSMGEYVRQALTAALQKTTTGAR